MNTNYYGNVDLKYPEIAVMIEPFINHMSPGTPKFYVPALLPFKGSSMQNSPAVPFNSSGLLNANSGIGLSSYSDGAYLNLSIPEWIRPSIPHDILQNIIVGTEFVVHFLAGDINKPRIIAGEWDGQ